jgi:hypothetical protein
MRVSLLNITLINPLFWKTKDKEMVYFRDNATDIHALYMRTHSKAMYITIYIRMGCPAVSTANY